jgi:hypothetical protein
MKFLTFVLAALFASVTFAADAPKAPAAPAKVEAKKEEKAAPAKKEEKKAEAPKADAKK